MMTSEGRKKRAVPTMSSWLFKLRQSHQNTSLLSVKRHLSLPWSKRFFCIEKDALRWYTSSDCRKELGFVTFLEVTSIRLLNCDSRTKDKLFRDEYGTFGVYIRANSRDLHLRCESRQIAKRWITMLRSSMLSWTSRDGTETRSQLKQRKANTPLKKQKKKKQNQIKHHNVVIVQEQEVLEEKEKENVSLVVEEL